MLLLYYAPRLNTTMPLMALPPAVRVRVGADAGPPGGRKSPDANALHEDLRHLEQLGSLTGEHLGSYALAAPGACHDR
jgi:hypothetical protein